MRRGAVVLLTLVTAATAALPPGPSAPAQAAPAGVREVTVRYGDGPVRTTSHRVLKVAFEGRRGHRVRLDVTTLGVHRPGRQCPRVSLLRHGRRIDGPEVATGFYRLPARDDYVLKVKNPPRCSARLAVRAQLVKLRTVDVGVGERVRLRKERGFAEAARVRVPATGAAMVRTTGVRRWTQDQGAVLLPGPGWRHRPGTGFSRGPDSLTVEGYPRTIPNVLLRAGEPVEYLHPYFFGDAGSPPASVRHRPPLGAGRQVLLMPIGAVDVSVSRPAVRTTTVEGPGVTTRAEPRGRRLVQARFSTATAQWLRVQLAVDGAVQDRLGWGAPGTEVVAVIRTDAAAGRVVRPFRDLVQVPAGDHELTVFARTTDGGRRAAVVRLLGVRTLPSLPADGSPVELASTEPGEWVLAPVDLDPARSYRVDVSQVETTRADGWLGYVHPPAPVWCRDIYCSAPYATLSDRALSADGIRVVDAAPNPWFALFAPREGVTGRATYRLTPTG